MAFGMRKTTLFTLMLNGLCWISVDSFWFYRLFTPPEENVVSLDQYREECLLFTNEKRYLHGSSPLRLNETLNTYAQEWAEHLLNNELFEHRNPNQYGENIFKGWGRFFQAEEVINSWYDEIIDYDYETHSSKNQNMIGHFTQIVWKSTEEVGVGMAYNSDEKTIVVVNNYNPPGNYIGRFANQVPPLKENAP